MVKNEALVSVTGWLNDVKDFEWGRAFEGERGCEEEEPSG